MVLALNIFIDKEGSIVDVYDQIFSLKGGGIYERCINSKHYEDRHRINEIKKYIHQISREIAIWMFENNPNRAFIPQEEYQRICKNVIQESKQENNNIEKDFLIGNYFKLSYCEELEANKLYFVHRSIYEYFVASTIYDSIEKSLLALTSKSQEEFACNIASYLKQGRITYTIGEYLKYKILKLYSTKLNMEKKNHLFYPWWESAIDKMMDAGMFFYTKEYINNYRNIISKENICFINLMEILRILQPVYRNKYIMKNVDKRNLKKYIRIYLLECEINSQIIDLRNMYLEKFKLKDIM